MSDTTDPISHVFDQTNGVVEAVDDGAGSPAGTGARSAAEPDEQDVDDTTVVPSPASGGRDEDAGASGGAGDPAAGSTPVATLPQDHPAHRAEAPASHPDDDSIAHVFDQTNGVVEGIEGDSDGTAQGDEASAADRGGLNEPNPVGQQDAWKDDHYGAEDGTDRNP